MNERQQRNDDLQERFSRSSRKTNELISIFLASIVTTQENLKKQ